MSLRLYNIIESDFDSIYNLTTNKQVMRYVGNGNPWTEEKIDRFISYNIEDQYKDPEKRDYFYYKIKCNGDFIGIIGVGKKRNRFELTVIIDPYFQGKGYFSKSLSLLENKLKEVSDKIYALVHIHNKKMNHIMMKKFYSDGETKIGKISLNRYIIFLRK